MFLIIQENPTQKSQEATVITNHHPLFSYLRLCLAVVEKMS